MEDSFAVIAAYGANAAMMHYYPTLRKTMRRSFSERVLQCN